jgi:cell division protein FtsN
VIQLAAYRSEQEAMAQYQQLKSRHGNLLGNLPPSVQQTNLGASGTFYRLGMGPMNSKQAATDLCNKLIAAGERDCLVRRR